MHVEGIVCDPVKAVDCLSYEILLSKLHYCGIQGIAASWFRSHLADRKQRG
jgi:hypothetical protein